MTEHRFEARTPSIYAHVVAHLPQDGPGLLPGGDDLPDEPPAEQNTLRWAAGAMDGVFAAHHGDYAGDQVAVDELVRLVACTVESRCAPPHFSRLYERLTDDCLLAVLDAVLLRVAGADLPREGVAELGRRLATEGRRREPVKFGIALLGVTRDATASEILMTLGRHEEFTLYAAVAIRDSVPDPEPVLLELAKVVDGWGRIEVVERLSGTTRAEVKDWLLRGGFRNKVMDEYLALIAATTGGLVDALAADEIDDELLDGACGIIDALINPDGPGQDIHDYADAPRALRLLVGHLDRRPHTLRHYLTAMGIAEFSARDHADDPVPGLTPGLREELITLCRAIMSRPEWRSMALRGLDSDDWLEFHQAERTARSLGIDTYPAHWRRLLANPVDGDWWAVLRQADDRRITEIVRLAEQRLPLARIAAGPSDALGLGPEWAPHRALGFVLQDLGRFPGHGWRLVATGLRSPVVSNRGMAVATLAEWGRDHWREGILDALEQAAHDEPHDGVRAKINELLRAAGRGDQERKP